MGELFVFSAEHASRLTGLSMRQLRYWDQQGFFVPQYANEDRSRPFSRVYSFPDIVGLRTLALLRKHGVSLQELRKVAAWFADRCQDPWSSLTFYVRGRRVFFEDPKEDNVRRTGSLPAQIAMPIEMEKIADEMREAVRRLRERKPEDIGKVTRNRYVLRNAWVIAGTRIPTLAIWNFHQAGYSVDAIIKQYPRLTPQDIQAAIEHESQQANRQRQEKRAS